jgi:hypothetical protein
MKEVAVIKELKKYLTDCEERDKWHVDCPF